VEIFIQDNDVPAEVVREAVSAQSQTSPLPSRSNTPWEGNRSPDNPAIALDDQCHHDPSADMNVTCRRTAATKT